MKIDFAGAALSWENKALIKEARKRGISSEWIDPRNVSYEFSEKIKLFHKGKLYKIPDVLLVRGGFANVLKDEGRIFINALETIGKTKIIEKPEVIFMDKDKITTCAILTKNKIPVPKTLYLKNKKDLKRIDFSPVVIKPLSGSKGKNIRKVSRLKMLPSRSNFIQKFISCGAKDTRVLVVGNKALGAMQRSARKKAEWRSNLALGGEGKPTELTEKKKELAVKVTKALNLEIAGIDIIEDENNKLYVLEANRAPQFRGFTKATKINVAKKIIDYLINV